MDYESNYTLYQANVFGGDDLIVWDVKDLVVQKGRIADRLLGHGRLFDSRKIYIIPGLIDCHVHITGEGNSSLAVDFIQSESQELADIRIVKNLQNCIAAGVTSVRDMGSFQRRALTFRNSKINHITRLFACGNLLTGICGHGKELGIETNPDMLEKYIGEEINAGADFVKIINDPIYFNSEQLRHAVEYAHAFARRVACHAYNEEAVDIAVKSKVDSIEHCGGGSDAILEEIYTNKIALIPTCIAAKDVVQNPEKAFLDREDQTVDIFRRWWETLAVSIPSSIEFGVKIGIGSDAGFPPTEFGISTWKEMGILNDFGLSWKDCINAATVVNAQILGLPELGNLRIGSHADFIIFDEDPILMGPEAINHIKSVYVGGACAHGVPIEEYLLEVHP